MTALIDYTQYKDFAFCEQKWFERFVQGVQREPWAVGPGGDDGPLVLGSLVHAGLEQYRAKGVPEFPASLVSELNASGDCAGWARLLLQHYCQRYPAEQFPLVRCEAPLRFDLGLPGITGFAKVDHYCYVPETTTLASGLPGWGSDFVLTPGYYIREYKTFAASRDRGLYLESWRVNMQADFQIHALSAHLTQLLGTPTVPAGIFVDVLEKPQPYVPKHTCKECKVSSKREDWMPQGDSAKMFSCPRCSNAQELNLANKSKKERVPEFYRFAVTRSPEQLARSHAEIFRTAERMQELRECGGLLYAYPSPERCISTTHGVSAKCDYWQPHVEGVGARGYAGYVQIERPLGYTGAVGV